MWREWLIREDLPGGQACADALAWVDTLPPETSWEQAWDLCSRGDWLLWVLARAKVSIPEAACRPAVLRAIRVYAADALDHAGLPERAETLRALADDALWGELQAAARAAWAAARYSDEVAAAAYAAAAWAAVARAAAAAAVARAAAAYAARSAEAAARAAAVAAAWTADAEHKLCADDVRRVCPCPAWHMELS